MYKKLKKLITIPAVRYTFYFILAFLAAIFHNLDNQDELWNYNFASCMANGLLPYRDFNMLQTPFSAFVNSIFLSIFGNYLVVIRITGAVLFLMIAIQYDKISRILKLKGSLVMTASCAFTCMLFWDVFLEYSTLIVFFTLFSMRFDLEVSTGIKKSMLQQLGVGVLMGCAMLSKQTTGTFMAVSSWIMCGVAVGIGLKAEEGSKAALVVKNVFFRMLGSSVPCFIFLFYLLGTGTFGDFWDMCYLGIFTFSAGYSYWTFMKENIAFFLLGVILVVLMIAGLVVAIAFRKSDKGRFSLIIFIYGLFSCLHMIPLANAFHVAIAFAPIMMLIAVVLPKRLFDVKGIRVFGGIFATAAGIFLILVNPITDLIDNDYVTGVRGLELTMDPPEKQENMKTIIEYVEKKNSEGTTVYILDNMAPLYFINSNQYHMYFDMFLSGNIGTITPTEALEQTEEGCIFLLPDSSRRNYQMPRGDEERYMETLTEIGRICDFTIFLK